MEVLHNTTRVTWGVLSRVIQHVQLETTLKKKLGQLDSIDESIFCTKKYLH